MVDYIDENLAGSRFLRTDLANSRFQLTQFSDVEFSGCEIANTRLHIMELSRVRLTGVELTDVEISGDVGNLKVNGVEVGPLVEAELDRLYPDRVKMRPADAAGFREAWDTLERLWEETVQRARRLDPEQLHESVGGEWSFIETLRHLVLVTDGWIRRTVLGDPAPFDALGLPWDDPNPSRDLPPGLTRDREARPSLETVLKLRRDRMATVREVVDGLTDESLDTETTPNPVPGWPESRAYRLRNVLLHLSGEEWQHRLYAERDLAVLLGR
ncbi:DinB family protein [Dactylosporangium darangshiense]|uniref:DinB family protein n=1 Tax=Dactylosporangium darangshiense TaxID=579108 RepID=A0ABP8D8P0_9ACTN